MERATLLANGTYQKCEGKVVVVLIETVFFFLWMSRAIFFFFQFWLAPVRRASYSHSLEHCLEPVKNCSQTSDFPEKVITVVRPRDQNDSASPS